MIVGLSQRVIYHNGQAYDSTDQAWYHYFKDQEIIPIPNRIDQDFKQLANKIDALVLTGGNDPNIRRITETRMATEMLLLNKPVVGICHGAFLLTTLNGGAVGIIEDHHGVSHRVYTNGEEHVVNSYHTMCINKAPENAIVLTTDYAGYCESWIEGKMAAVVWHPERMKNPYLPKEVQNLLM